MQGCNCPACKPVYSLASKRLDSWTSQDGRTTKFCDLKMDHLLNIVAVLERNKDNLQRHKIISLKKELVKRLTAELQS